MNQVVIGNVDVPIIMWKGQRVITTELLAAAYGTEMNNVKNNFNNNKSRFNENEHYFYLEGAELKGFKRLVNDIDGPLKYTSRIYLWTRKGASRHSKILDTDQAWKQFDILEEHYFNQLDLPSYQIADPIERAKKWIEEESERQRLVIENEGMKPLADFAKAVESSENSIEVGEYAKILHDQNIPIGRNKMFALLREYGYLMNNNIPYQTYIDNGFFEVVEKVDKFNKIYLQTYVTGKGQSHLLKKIREHFDDIAWYNKNYDILMLDRFEEDDNNN